MKKIFIIYIATISSLFANVIIEENEAYKKGKSCLEKQYGKSDFEHFDKIHSRVACVNKVKASETGKIENLNCPSNTIFENFYTNSDNIKNSTCLRPDRNKKLKRFENVNCNCVTASLKENYKEKYQEKLDSFKKELRKKAMDNIGKRLVTKIQTIKKSDRSINNSKNYCFNHKTQRLIQSIVDSKKCGDKNFKDLPSTISEAFGEALNLDLSEGESPEKALSKFLSALNEPERKIREQGNNSCFKSPGEFEDHYNTWSTHPGFVNLRDNFELFLNKYDPNSPNLNEEFYQFLKERRIDLHPALETLAHSNLKSLLSSIKEKTKKGEMTLEDFLEADDKSWKKKAIDSVNKACGYIIKDIKEVLCPKADFAYDDPEFIEMIFEDSKDKKNGMARAGLLSKDLELKALYCEREDIHKIDADAKALAIKAKYKNSINLSGTSTKYLDSSFYSGLIKGFKSQDPTEADKLIERVFNLAIPKGISKEAQNHAKAQTLHKLTDYLIVEGKLAQAASKGYRKGSIPPQAVLIRAAMKKKRAIAQEKQSFVKNMSEDIFSVSKTNKTKSEFTNDFLNSYNERNHTNTITKSLKNYKTSNFKENLECTQNFKNIYCSTDKKVLSTINNEEKRKCFREKLPDALKGFFKEIYPSVKNPSSICDYSETLTSSSSSKQEDVTNRIHNFFNNGDIYKDGGFCSQMTFREDSSKLAGNYSIEDSDVINEIFVESISVDTIFSDDRIDLDDVVSEMSNSIKSKDSTIKVETMGNSDIKKSGFMDQLMIPESKDSNSIFSNSFANSAFSSDSSSDEEDKEDDLTKKVNDSQQNLMDYIASLEDKLKKKEQISKSEMSNKDLEELKSLQKELDDLKNKTALIKNQKLSSPVKEQKTVTKTLPQTKASTSNFRAVSSDSPVITKKSYKEESDSSEDLLPPTSQRTSTANNLQKENKLSLKTNSSIAEFQGSGQTESNKKVKVNFNDNDYNIEVILSKSGEVICKFDEEETNNLKSEELESICEEYKKMSKKRAPATTEAPKDIKIESPKEEKQRSQKFKVKDLNSILKN